MEEVEAASTDDDSARLGSIQRAGTGVVWQGGEGVLRLLDPMLTFAHQKIGRHLALALHLGFAASLEHVAVVVQLAVGEIRQGVSRWGDKTGG